MECSLINIEKIPNEVIQDAMENGTQVTIIGKLQSLHFSDGAINKAYEKAEAFDEVIECLGSMIDEDIQKIINRIEEL